MNALFGSLTTDGLEEAQDVLGGFAPLDTDVYGGTVKNAYAGQSAGGARNVTLILDLNGREYRETVYITNRKGENFSMAKDKQQRETGKKRPLPGFVTIDDLCMVATGKPLSEQATEEKVVNVYDSDAKKELPKSVPVLIDLLGKGASFAIVRQLENKNEKQGDEYVPTAETRETNYIDKVFDTASKLTVVEAKAESTAVFWDAWVEKNKGKTRDKRTVTDDQGGTTGRPGARTAPQPGAGTARKSLFGGN